MNKKHLTFNEFCHKYCDRMYEPRLPEEAQCTGYKRLKYMVQNNIKPATLKQMLRWETKPTKEELFSEPDIKYLRFLHVLLRPFIIKYWSKIKNLKID